MKALLVDLTHAVNGFIKAFRVTNAEPGHLDSDFNCWKASFAGFRKNCDLMHFGWR